MYPEPNRPGWRHAALLLSETWARPEVPRRAGPAGRDGRRGGQPGQDVDAGYLTSSGGRAALDDAQAQLEPIAGSRTPVTMDLDGLGRYRVVAASSRRGGDVIVTGLSMSDVDATMIRMLMIFGIVTVDRAGRRDDRRRRDHPASADAAAPRRRKPRARSSDLPLDRGEVELPVRVPESDANPSTEVGQLGSALNRMLDHIAAALSTRQASETRVRQFVADASHELRTPLAAIRGYTELAQRDGTTTATRWRTR